MTDSSAASSLVWSPLGNYLTDNTRRIHLLIAPFITRAGLQPLLDSIDDLSELEVITRWKEDDISSGASDPEIYPLLKELDIPLYIHQNIHLKLMVFDESQGFHASGNITANGLGFSRPGNVEIGCEVLLTPNDWVQISILENSCIPVTDYMYQRAMEYKERTKPERAVNEPLNFEQPESKPFSWRSLPCTSSPEELWRIYSEGLANDDPLELAAAVGSDIANYDIPRGLAKDDFLSLLGDRFRNHPFIMAFVENLREKGSVHFGGVKAWLQQNCSDKPQPYRRELTTTTRLLYDWLSFFFKEISWNQPNVSMIVYWEDPHDR